MSEMTIVNRKVSDLNLAGYNPRKLNKKQYDDLLASIKKFGIVDPIIVNKHPDRMDTVVGGHKRLEIWSGLGNKEIATVEVDLPLEEEKELNIRLNLNVGMWDWELLDEHFGNEPLLEFGFTPTELKLKSQDKPPVDPRYDDLKKFEANLSQDQKDFVTQVLSNIRRRKAFKEREFTNPDNKGNALYFLVEHYDDLT